MFTRKRKIILDSFIPEIWGEEIKAALVCIPRFEVLVSKEEGVYGG